MQDFIITVTADRRGNIAGLFIKPQVLIVLIRPLPFVTSYVAALSHTLKQFKSSAQLTCRQQAWLVAVLVGIAVTQTLNWAVFERRSLNQFKQGCLRWMFSYAKIAWTLLLQASIKHLLAHYQVASGVLVADDTGKVRSKQTTKISFTHKIKDKKTGGYFNGQELVFLLLVTDLVTIPVGFRFYTPDPELVKWRKENKALKHKGVPGRLRPARPAPNPEYPTKQELTLQMIKAFSLLCPDVKVNSVLADTLYGTGAFMEGVNDIMPDTQVVSQLRTNQLIRMYGKWVSLKSYFARHAGVKTEMVVRGGQTKQVTMLGHRLYVKAHGKKRFVIALKYEGEEEYRFIVASHLCWRHTDIARVYTLRWLVEVFIEDWKCHEGWNALSKHQGDKGAMHGVTLSLLCDHMLLLHPEQTVRLKNKQPGLPVGCLTERLKAEALIDAVESIVTAEHPSAALNSFTQALHEALPERESSKHMAGLDLGRMEPTASLSSRAAAQTEAVNRMSIIKNYGIEFIVIYSGEMWPKEFLSY